MRYDFTQEQLALEASVRRLFEAESSATAVRELWETRTGRSPALWQGLVDIGITSVMVPEEYGGLGGDVSDLALVLEQVGRYVVPDALVESCVLAPFVLSSGDDEELKARWLPPLASGAARATVALAGTTFPPDVHVSDLVVLEREGQLVLFEPAELEVEPVTAMDRSRRLFAVRPLGSGRPVGDQRLAARAGALRDVATASVLNGIAAALVERTAEYVKVRRQFGRTLGSFQAVKHQLAQAHSRNVLARRATHTATYRVAADDPIAGDAAALAKICAIESEFESNRVALQLHGGIGFTWEHDLQLWLKRGKALEQAHGARADLFARAGRSGLEATSVAVGHD
jgi:alkylation response protein AidB-like acyl-CoA dehydrogenase